MMERDYDSGYGLGADDLPEPRDALRARISQLEAGVREIADYDFPGTLRCSELVAEIKAIARALLKGQS